MARGRVFETDRVARQRDNDGGSATSYERANGATNLVSAGPTAGCSPIDMFFLGMSQDGLHIYFMSYEPLVSADNDSGRRDVYERFNGSTNLVSTGPAMTNALLEATGAATPDGASVWFLTAEKLVSQDTDSSVDVYERTGGTTTLISTGSDRRQRSRERVLLGGVERRRRVFFSTAEALVGADQDASRDIYERRNGRRRSISTGPDGGNGRSTCDSAESPSTARASSSRPGSRSSRRH